MSNNSHAKKELDILAKQTPDALINEFSNEIIALCDKFHKSGQSGGSAPYVAYAISQSVEKLLLFKTVAPLTGEDDEWNDISRYGDEIQFQNKRDSATFKNADGKVFYIDAIVFKGDIGGSFTTNGSVTLNGVNIKSAQLIKEFPFYPKTFYVDVIDQRWKDKEETELDVNGDWWTHTIKDENQLKEVFEYYELFL